MSSSESEETLSRLKELSVMKELDREYEAGTKTDAERDAYLRRQQRHQEILQDIKKLARQKKTDLEIDR